MPIHSPKNLYQGVNPHLNSILQNRRGYWKSFHTEHIIDLRKAIEQSLPPNYVALSEQSLQADLSISPRGTRPGGIIPDVFVASRASSTRTPITSQAGSAPLLLLPVEDTLPALDEDGLSAIAIYKLADGDELRTPCTLIEVLSPANKPPHSGYEEYMRKRGETLQSGVRLVEIDYLHETRSPIIGVPNYLERQKDSYPYTIAVSDPRPNLKDGKTAIYAAHVNEPLPAITIPLEGADTFTFNFDDAYTTSYGSRRYHEDLVDYEQLPVNFESYAPEDQARILARMEIIKNEQKESHS